MKQGKQAAMVGGEGGVEEGAGAGGEAQQIERLPKQILNSNPARH